MDWLLWSLFVIIGFEVCVVWAWTLQGISFACQRRLAVLLLREPHSYWRRRVWLAARAYERALAEW